MILEDREARYAGAKEEGDDPVEDIIRHWEEQIGNCVNPEEMAVEALKAFNAARGIPWDDTPVEVDWRTRDEEIPGVYMGGAQGAQGEQSKKRRIERQTLDS